MRRPAWTRALSDGGWCALIVLIVLFVGTLAADLYWILRA